MKKIMTAMGNDVLNNELRKYAKYDVLLEDLFCQDVVMSQLPKTEAEVLIMSGLLQGRWNIEEFVERMRKENKTIRIIMVTDEIDQTTKKILNDLNVLDIFLDSTVEVADIMDAIDREETMKKKYEMLQENVAEYQVGEKATEPIVLDTPKEKYIVEKAVQKQEVIVISGTPGSGKSTVAVNFCRTLAQKSDSKILLLDLDTLNGNLDEILKIDKVPSNVELIIDHDKKSGLNYATELMMKNRFDANVFGELVIEVDGFDVLTGNTSLHYCQNVLAEEYYQKILQCAKEKYDYIVIDTSSNIFLDSTKWAYENASRVLFVTEGNYLSMKKMQQFLHIAVDIWGVLKQKIDIIVNKKYKNEVEEEMIQQITEGLKVVGEIKLNEQENALSYEKILSTIHYIPKKSIFEKWSAMKKNLFVMNQPNQIEKGVAVHVN